MNCRRPTSLALSPMTTPYHTGRSCPIRIRLRSPSRREPCPVYLLTTDNATNPGVVRLRVNRVDFGLLTNVRSTRKSGGKPSSRSGQEQTSEIAECIER
jgi:hypothetical protein